MTRVGIITQARMTSTRLPGKVLLPAGGVSMLDHHLNRLSPLGLPIVVATTTNTDDDPIASAAAGHGALVHRGSEHDVLGRFSEAAKRTGLDIVIRVTADCPLIDPAPIARGLELFATLDDPHAHVSNVLERTYPRGLDFEVFSASALHDAAENAVEPADREHVTPYLYLNRSGLASMHAVRRADDASGFRITLDTEDDLVLLRTLIEEHTAHLLDAEQLIALLREHPDLAGLNAHIEQKKLGE